MSLYILEVGKDAEPSLCKCCGKTSCVAHGFVYKQGDAYAVYFASWSTMHTDKKVMFAIAIGEWDDSSSVADRTCFGIEAQDLNNDIGFRVFEPEESPWPENDLLGVMLSRDEALNNKLLDEVFEILEYVLHNHSALKKYLDIQD